MTIKKSRTAGFGSRPGQDPTGNAKPYADVQISVPQHIADTIVAEFESEEPTLIANIASQYLQLGYQMSRVAGASATTKDLQMVLDNGSNALLKHHEDVVNSVADLTKELEKVLMQALEAENKNLAKTLFDAKEEFTVASSLLTDGDNVNSIPFQVAKAAEEHVTNAISKSHQALDIASEGSFANKLFAMFESKLDELSQKQAAHKASLDEQTHAMREALGLQKKIEEVEDKSSAKGTSMEDVVGDCLTIIAGNHGDVAENIGNVTDGIGKSKKGDHLITVMLDGSPVGKIVFEDKAGTYTMSGPTSLPSQLSDAAINYNASLCVGVVTENGPKKVSDKGYQKVGSNCHIVVVDWKNQDFTGLEILYPILRELIIVNHLAQANQVDEIDKETLVMICEEQLQKLHNFNKIKKNLRSTVALTANNIADEIGNLQLELKESFTKMLHAVKQGGAS